MTPVRHEPAALESSTLPLSHCAPMLMTYANSFDLDQARQNDGSDLDPNCLTLTLKVFMKEFFDKNNFEKKISR